MNERRIGKFYVSGELAQSEDFAKAFEILRFIPYRVEFLFDRSAFEYVGVSPLFDLVSTMDRTPLYNLIIHSTMDDVGEELIGVRPERVEEPTYFERSPVCHTQATLVKVASVVCHLREYVETEETTDLQAAAALTGGRDILEFLDSFDPVLLPLKRNR